MEWKIVADSSSDPHYLGELSEDIKLTYVPFSVQTDNNEYIDDGSVDVKTMVEDMYASKNLCKTACPPSGTWLEEFKEADYTIAITISSQLSGSYQSALVAKDMLVDEDPTKKVIVVDSKSAGPELALGVRKAIEYINNGLTIEEIEPKLNKYFLDTHIVFPLCSFENFIKSGRMSKIAGFVAKAMKMWGLGTGSDEGVIVVAGKARSEAKAIEMALNIMEQNGFNNGDVSIAHCLNEQFAIKAKTAILNKWPDSSIEIGETQALCSFYAEKEGVLISYVNKE